MAITLSPADIADLRAKAGFSARDFFYLWLREQKDPASSSQNVVPSSLSAYQITDDQVHSFLRSLSSGRTPVITLAPANLTLTWSNINEVSALTQAQVLADYQAGVLTIRQLSYYAVLLQKTAGNASQIVNPASFAGAPWNIPQADLVSNLYAVAADDTPKFAVDVAQFTINWISPVPA